MALVSGGLLALCGIVLVARGADVRAASPAADDAALAARLDQTLSTAQAELGVPAVTAAAIREGSPIWLGSVGVKEVGGSEPVSAETRFITASTGKTVTAAIVLSLVDSGRIRLRAPVSRYLPGLVGARRILVVDLLRHSSGLPDYLASRRINQIITGHPHHRWTRAEVLGSVHRLRFPPGSRYSYSNTNYIALGGIVERVTELTIQESFERMVATPLGLADTDWRYGSLPIEDFARPYVKRRGGELRNQWGAGFVPTDFWGEVWTDGGLATTSEELAEIANAMVVGDLLRPATQRRMLSFGRGGAGLGVFRERLDGRLWIGHDGLYAGFSSQHWTDPGTGVTIAVMTDLETTPDTSWAIWKRLARTYQDAG